MTRRIRSTWSKFASAAPALPGYGTEDQDHPAFKPDPDANKYQTGDTSSWAEDVHGGPYAQSAAPALPGYGSEDKGHPAQKLATLNKLAYAKSVKCVKIAKKLLGKTASEEDLQEQALAFMDVEDDVIDQTLARMGGDFLAGAEFDSDLLDDDADDDFIDGDEDDDILARKYAADEVEDADEEGTEKEASHPLVAMFDQMDAHGTGFIMQAEWKGPRKLFAALDTDRDGIIARVDLLASLEDDDAEDEDDEVAPKASKKAADAEAEDEGEDEFEKEAAAEGDEDEEGNEFEKEACGDLLDVALNETDDLDGALDFDLSDNIDPMGFGSEDGLMGLSDDDDLLAMFAKSAGEGEAEAEAETKDAKKLAKLRPQPRKPSNGVQRVGGAMTRTASKAGADLSGLWRSAPDVSEAFK